jgi:hypothetical protein
MILALTLLDLRDPDASATGVIADDLAPATSARTPLGSGRSYAPGV